MGVAPLADILPPQTWIFGGCLGLPASLFWVAFIFVCYFLVGLKLEWTFISQDHIWQLKFFLNNTIQAPCHSLFFVYFTNQCAILSCLGSPSLCFTRPLHSTYLTPLHSKFLSKHAMELSGCDLRVWSINLICLFPSSFLLGAILWSATEFGSLYFFSRKCGNFLDTLIPSSSSRCLIFLTGNPAPHSCATLPSHGTTARD